MTTTRDPSAGAETPHIVGIGASAGGLEAIEQFFDHLPRVTGAAYVVVQHLSPDFKSLMDELLARHTNLPIKLVEDGMTVLPNTIYLIPPKKEMIIAGGRLLLSERDHHQELTLPIDVFFRSLAQDCGPRAIAIVLSGGGSDGSRGIRDVFEAGGLVIVQDVESAQFDGMPRNARDSGVAHWILPPSEMPRVLVEHIQRPGRPNEPDARGGAGGYEAVYQMLEHEFGIDFTHYKPSTVTRRIERRLQLARMENLADYVTRLEARRDELDLLYRDLLIGVTRFFRNQEAFEILEGTVIPELMRRGPRDTPLRVWIAGCATGEEAYSLAILLAEASARHGDRPVKIFATDVHPGSIEAASRAAYGEEAVANVSPERRERWFHHRGGSYHVVPELRQMVVFAAHDVIRDSPFTRMDLVTCRNLLIYLQPGPQQKVLSLFHFALNRGGVLFLGPSETPGALANDFEIVDRHWRIYRKFSDVRMSVAPRSQRPRVEARTLAPALGSLGRPSVTSLLATYDALLDEVMPSSLLVTERGELVHVFGGASRFLRRRDGRQGLDVLEAVEGDLRMVLVGGLQRVRKEPAAVVFRGVHASTEDPDATYNVTVRRIGHRGRGASHVLIQLDVMDGAPDPSAAPPRSGSTEIPREQVPREQVRALEEELAYTKENLQAAVEELETGNEELQAANEELVASNEELQSTNEELQSVNEELYTVNAEYQRKIAELTEVTNDLDNLLSATDVGTIFLDRELRIRKFTPELADNFTLLPQDVGRSIEDFTHRLEHPELIGDLRRVVETSEPVEREIRNRDGRAYFLRLLPYRAKGESLGVVLTLIDVTPLKVAEDALFHERYLLNSLLEHIPDAIYFKDSRGRFIRASHAMAERLGLADPRQAVGKTAFELPDSGLAVALHQHDEAVLRSGKAQPYRLEKRSHQDDDRWDMVARLPLLDPAKRPVGMVAVFRDVTEQRRGEERIEEAVRRRDEFLAMLSHELRNPLGSIVTATALLRREAERDAWRNKLLAIVDRQSQQMSRLLDDLLEVSRVTQNKIELRRTTVDLTETVRDAGDAVRATMDERGVELTVEIPTEPAWVDGDPARLLQIQVNILGNAAKYTPRGGHVRLSMTVEGASAVIRVKDDGVGMPKELLADAFELFVQSQRTLDRADGGLGVGLTLVRSLVTMHGGTVEAISEGASKGTEVIVRLPLGHAPEVTIPRSVRQRPASGRKPRIVVIEDNHDSREMLCELLELHGFDCKSSERGDAGLTLIRETHPDVALVDIGLPGIDGFEVARSVRRDRTIEHVFLVALTGYGQENDRKAALAAGFDAHMVKPVSAEALFRLLGEAEPTGTTK
ncbi:MAG: PAS domain-containing protein [Deltaproteobacteria bacterium]|nr:PAS domain-containing protein [Deltaproteobacteria bacterium]